MKPKKSHNLLFSVILIIFSLQLIGLGFLFFLPVKIVSAQIKETLTGENVEFRPQVDIPGSSTFRRDIKEPIKFNKENRGLLLAQYIQAWYKFAVAGVGILAVVMIMAGGLIWLTAGGRANQISTAKDWIAGAIVGLVLALMSYTLLDILNPDLVTFQSLAIDDVTFVPTSDICCFPKNGPQPAAPSSNGCVIKDNNGNEETGVSCNIMQACIQTVEDNNSSYLSLYHCADIEKGKSVCMSEKDCPEGWFCVNEICYNGIPGDPCDLDKPSCATGFYCSRGIYATNVKPLCYDGAKGDLCNVVASTVQCNEPMICKGGTCQYDREKGACFPPNTPCSDMWMGNDECCNGDCMDKDRVGTGNICN